MLNYVLKRLLLMIPTLIGIMLINFTIIQFLPGGPMESLKLALQGEGAEFDRILGSTESATIGDSEITGVDSYTAEYMEEIAKRYRYDRPLPEQFVLMMRDYFTFDFGYSFDQPSKRVMELVAEKLPVSISLGLWSTLLAYLISIPLGIAKAVRDGTRFDSVTSMIIIVGYAIPSVLFPIILLVLFAGGSFWQWFPSRGLTSRGFDDMTLLAQLKDYFWHITLPTIAGTIASFATLTLLTKNSFLDEIKKQYVTTARAKGLSEKRVLYGHVFRNAMLIIVAGIPTLLISVFFTGSIIIESTFSLDGLGLLSFQSAVNRDFPVMLGTLYFYSLIGLVLHLISDITYTLIDPRIDFESRKS